MESTVKLSVSKAIRYAGEPIIYATLNGKAVTNKDLTGYIKTEVISEEIPLSAIKDALDVKFNGTVVKQKMLLNRAKLILELITHNKNINYMISKKVNVDVEKFMKTYEELMNENQE